MIERDYIMRLFMVLGRAASRIMFFRETKKYDKALAEIDNAARTLLGLSLEMIERMPVAGMKDVLGSDPALLRPKLYTAGVLLKEKAETLALQKNEDQSVDLYMKSLYFFMDTVPELNDFGDTRGIQTIDFVIDKLRDYELPIDLRCRLAAYFENLGRYDKSEDVIFEIVDEDPRFLQDGISFYKRLLLKSDFELADGHLPRNEVEESLAQLRKKLMSEEETSDSHQGT